eukprot:TRINITY_DN21004_c0_g1_i1.p1 TRINITY_DN21004_c0_g1~~TRINITY_DN21004_c0_g1_i1.p1  ORF type:complete len:585 (-),score=150.04 TRINITY_DN21004_c0_g1_i1:131-1885(-)
MAAHGLHGPAGYPSAKLARRPSDRVQQLVGETSLPSFQASPIDVDDLKSLPMSSVVKIWTHSAAPSYMFPWQVSDQQEWTGSGFAVMVDGKWRILTNAHVVDCAVVVRVTRQNESRKVKARVVSIAHDLDLALLEVKDESFRDKVPTVQFAERIPSLFSEVKAIGYPEGGTTICVTKGVVSRVDAQTYAHAEAKGILSNGFNNPGRLLIVQIDAAINGGSSGGPAVNQQGRIIGVASSGMDHGQNIGYIIPTCLVQNFLAVVSSTGRWRGIPEPGFVFRCLESAPLRDFLQVPSGRTGVQLTSVAPFGALAKHAQPGDVLLKIGGQDVSNEGTVLLPDQEVQLPLEHLITSKRETDMTKLLLWRIGAKKEEEVEVKFAPIPPLLPRFHGFDAEPTFFIFGGLVFSRLTTPLIQEFSFGEDYLQMEVPEGVYEKTKIWKKGDEEVIILMRVLKHEVNEGISTSIVRVLETVNDKPVSSLADVVEAAMTAVADGTKFVKFGFNRSPSLSGRGNCACELIEVLRADEALEADEEILTQHQVPAPVSADLESVYEAHAPANLAFVKGWLNCLKSLAGCRKSKGAAVRE